MRGRQIPAPVVLTVMLLAGAVAGVDCDELGDLLRGPESRTLAAAALTEISGGVIDAFIIAISEAIFGVAP